jgi:primary-amine oxidase
VAQASDNYVWLIEAYYPPKAAALAYLTAPSTAEKPDKFARVTIHHGASHDPVVKDYLVGPLPISAQTEMKQLTEIYHRPDIPYNARGITLETEFPGILGSIMPPLADAMQVCLPSRHASEHCDS